MLESQFHEKKMESLQGFQQPATRPQDYLSYNIKVGGIPVCVHSSNKGLQSRIAYYFRNYETSEKKAAAQIFMIEDSSEEPEAWDHNDSDFYHESRDDVVRVFQRDFVMSVSNHSSGELVGYARVRPKEDDAFKNILRWTIPYLGLDRGVLLFHSAAVIDRTQSKLRGLLFLGQSGAGKTTLSEIIRTSVPQSIILGDDASLVTNLDKEPILSPAPLGGSMIIDAPQNITAPLSRIYLLKQSPESRVEEIPKSTQIRGIAASLMSASNMDGSQLIKTAMVLAGQIQVKRLHFDKSPSFWEKLQNDVR